MHCFNCGKVTERSEAVMPEEWGEVTFCSWDCVIDCQTNGKCPNCGEPMAREGRADNYYCSQLCSAEHTEGVKV